MARLVTSGGEVRDHPTSDIGSPDGVAAGAALCVTDTTEFRSGLAAIKCPGTSSDSSYRWWPFTAPASGQTVCSRAYFRVSALPSSTVKVGAFVTAADAALVSVRLTSAGNVQLWNDAASAQIGSDSALTVELDSWYRFQMRLLIGSGAVDEAELLVKSDDYQSEDEQIVGTSLTVSDTHAARFRAGWVDAPGVTADMWLDDVAVNDSTGTKQTSFPSDGSVVLIPPSSVGSPGSWDGCDGNGLISTSFDYFNKTPPAGLADHATAGHTGATAHQARVGVNTAQSLTVNPKQPASLGMLTNLTLLPSTGTSTVLVQTGNVAGSTRRAQSFMFGAPVTVDSVRLNMGKTGTPTDNAVVELQTDSGGLPSGTVLATGSLPASAIGVGVAAPRFALSKAVPLDPATTYWIVLGRSGALDASNYFRWLRYTTAKYDEGDPAVHDGSAWVQTGATHSTSDHLFAVEVMQGVKAVSVVYAVACHGEAVTGVKAGTVAITGVGSAKSFNFGDNVGVAGTYPSNWRWAAQAPTYDYTLPDTPAAVNITKASGSGAGNFVDACFLGVVLEYTRPPVGWTRWQKTADSTFHQAKFCASTIDFETAGGLVTVAAGDWAIYPEPEIDAGEDFPATLTSIADATLKAGYTLV